jgi:hypothetical protein
MLKDQPAVLKAPTDQTGPSIYDVSTSVGLKQEVQAHFEINPL